MDDPAPLPPAVSTPAPSPDPRPAGPRLAHIDALRGFAVAQMIVYHFVYDLKLFGWIDVVLTRDQPWLAWRTAIVTQFLLLVGVGLTLRDAYRPQWRPFLRRWARIAGAAALVSLGSWMLFGPRFIWFGVLHFVALALLLGRPLLRFGPVLAPVGVAIIAAGALVTSATFNPPALSWIGFPAQRPRTEDFVPVFPWFGVVLLGMVAGRWWARHGYALGGPLAPLQQRPPRLLVLLGAWSLTVYLVHQPVLLGVLWLVKRVIG